MTNEIVNIEVREDGSHAVESNWNAMAAAGENAGSVSEALQKIMQGVQSTMDKLNTSITQLNNNLAKQTTTVAQATQAATQQAKATDATTSAVQKLGETEQQATDRIKAMVQSSLAQVEAQNQVTASTVGSIEAIEAQAAATTEAAAANAASAAGYTAGASAMVQQIMAVERFNDTLSSGIKNISQWRDVEGQLVAAVGNGTLSMKQFEQMTAQLDAQLPHGLDQQGGGRRCRACQQIRPAVGQDRAAG
jgi:CII-binding regulator of phage lambda lysogenization HflD